MCKGRRGGGGGWTKRVGFLGYQWGNSILVASFQRGKGSGSGNGRYTSQPLPMLHPTTPHALPFARISNGKISAGYSHGTVSHVAPNIAVNRKTKKVAAIPAPKRKVFRGISIAFLLGKTWTKVEKTEQIWRSKPTRCERYTNRFR